MAVAAAELIGAGVAIYLESCCRSGGRDWLLMAMVPNVRAVSLLPLHIFTADTAVMQAISVVVYTSLRDLGVLMRTQYGRTDTYVAVFELLAIAMPSMSSMALVRSPSSRRVKMGTTRAAQQEQMPLITP